jgi:hypothetical protein
MRRGGTHPLAVMAAVAVALAGVAAARVGAQPLPAPEIVATGVLRPLQLALSGRRLLILGPGQGDAAGEIHQVNLDGELPVDLARQPRIRVPFHDSSPATLGSLAIDPGSGQLLLGEENGTRIYQLGPDSRLAVYATGLNRLPGGSTLSVDRQGRLWLVDNVDRALSGGEERAPPGLDAFRDEDYTGPLVFRLSLQADIPLPRRLDRAIPVYPRGARRQPGGLLPRFISLAALPGGEVALLTSAGELLRLGGDGALVPLARLPTGQGMYNRTNMVAGPDGALYVSGGFHVARIFRVTPDGTIHTLARGLADPEGITIDDRGYLYVAESSFHRVVRLRLTP